MIELNIAEFLNPHRIIEIGGLLLVIAIIYIETGFFLGFVLPGGDYMLFAAGMFCGSEFLEIPLGTLVTLLIIASFLGDTTGYFKGKWLGEKLFTKQDSRLFKRQYLERGNRFYEKYGIWAFIMGRFMPVIRTLVPMIAGASSYNFRKFLVSNFAGSVVWIGTLVPLGYFIGRTYPDVINHSVWILVGFILIASIPMLKILVFKK